MRSIWVLLAILSLTVCCPGPAATPQPVSAPAPTPSSSAAAVATAQPSSDPVGRRAEALVSLATEVEPDVTPLLKRLAAEQGGEMVKLEYRLKTRASTERKIRERLASQTGLTAAEVRIDDALRYTMKLADEPPGHYVQAARRTLAALEKHGHVVQYVKNYWPRDDNYSGVNSVLLDTASGLFWELQFHTPQSFVVQTETRPHYEELRRVGTPVERKRELFDEMTKRWNAVKVPKGALQRGALHEKDQVRSRKRP
jgi:hypothetical protein